jgi:hypothetical protein
MRRRHCSISSNPSILHNTSIAFFPRTPPSSLVQALTLVSFPLLSFVSPPLMGACLVYDQLALSVGQYTLAHKAVGGVGDAAGALGGGGGVGWAYALAGGAGLTAAVTWLRYNKDRRWV